MAALVPDASQKLGPMQGIDVDPIILIELIFVLSPALRYLQIERRMIFAISGMTNIWP